MLLENKLKIVPSTIDGLYGYVPGTQQDMIFASCDSRIGHKITLYR